MVKTCVLVMGGEIEDTQAFAKAVASADFVMAADSGAGHLLNLGLMPQILMGDLDSIVASQLAQIEASDCRVQRFLSSKDDTDGGLILKEAIALGYQSIELWGALGGRMDHSFANLMLLLLPEIGACTVCIRDGGLSIFLPKQGQKISGNAGDIISLFALGEPVTGFRNEGLKYQPPGDRYEMNFPLGISNELVENEARLNWEKGKLLCMHYRRIN